MATLRQAEAQHQAVVAKLSPEARMADEKLSTIAKSASMTAMQKQAEIQKIISCKFSFFFFLAVTLFLNIFIFPIGAIDFS